MGALSFKERFVEPVLAGLQGKAGGKRQSIRNFRKRPLKVGERVVLYFAQRTKWCRKLGESVIKSVDVVVIHFGVADFVQVSREGLVIAHYDRRTDLDRFAREDGFKDFEDMRAFWIAEHGKKKSSFFYCGNLYKW